MNYMKAIEEIGCSWKKAPPIKMSNIQEQRDKFFQKQRFLLQAEHFKNYQIEQLNNKTMHLHSNLEASS